MLFHDLTALAGPGLAYEFTRAHWFRHTTVGGTPLNEWSARRRDLYLTLHDTHKRQTSLTLAEFEPAIPGSQRPQTHALDRAASVGRSKNCEYR